MSAEIVPLQSNIAAVPLAPADTRNGWVSEAEPEHRGTGRRAPELTNVPTCATSDPSAAEVKAELRALRKGHGLQLTQSIGRVGPALRAVCEVSEQDRPHEAIAKVADWLWSSTACWPWDLSVSVVGAFGLHEQARLHLLRDRIVWIAQQLGRDPRTARRRSDLGIEVLAEVATRTNSGTAGARVRPHIDCLVELAWSDGTIASSQARHFCRIVACATSVDRRDHHLAIVELLNEERATLAIPVTRIRIVTPLDYDGTRRPLDAGPKTNIRASLSGEPGQGQRPQPTSRGAHVL